MKTLIVLLFLIAGVGNPGFCQVTSKAPIKKVTARDLKLMIQESSGPMIINFWATWCGPCIREISWFDSIITKKNSPVNLVLVSLDDKAIYPRELPAFIKKHGYKQEVLFLDETNIDDYISLVDPKWRGGIPASIFVNNRSNYYKLFNQQIPGKRFEIELDKLCKSGEIQLQ